MQIKKKHYLPKNFSAGANDWLAMAQQAQLLAGMGGGMTPQMLSQLYGTNNLLNSSLTQPGASKDSKSASTKPKVELSSGVSQPALTPSPSSLGRATL